MTSPSDHPKPPDDSSLLDEMGEYTPDEGAAYAPLTYDVSGEVMRIVYATSDGSYTVAKLRNQDGTEISLVGSMPGLQEGQELKATGHWEFHKDHGRQFKVLVWQSVLPSSIEGIRRFLASGVLPGIGATYAQRIVNHFGLETLKILDNCSSRLREVPGIGKKRIQEIREAWQKSSAERQTRVYLQGLGISTALCTRLIQKYGCAAAGEIVKRNPYRLANEVDGVGFLTADAIANKLGVKDDDPLRLCSGMVYAMNEITGKGHTCCPEELLLLEAEKLLQAPQDKLRMGLETAILENTLIREKAMESGEEVHLIFPRRLYQYEITLAHCIRVLLNASCLPLAIPPQAIPQEIQLNTLQLRAVHNALQYIFSIITGGPGVGKTTVINTIVRAFSNWKQTIYLAAPTGRAARRLKEATHKEAQTIHRMLKWDAASHSFVFNQDKPLACQVLIVDEVSMLDTQLAQNLFSAVAPGTRVILVGDRDQLPSVGPGAVLFDLINCGKIPVTHLTEVYRQAQGSRIITNSHAVNNGYLPDLRPLPPPTDFYWIDSEDPTKINSLIQRMLTDRIPRVFGYDPIADVQLLAPMRKGDCGTTALNAMLQESLNPRTADKPEIQFGNRLFRLGDKVMQIANNYDKGVFNGEAGIITVVNTETGVFTVDFDSIHANYSLNDCDQLQLAYAVTVHKSQGSEYPVVIMPVLTQHYVMLQRNLIYTGMTRAKKLLIMLGSKKALAMAVKNNTPQRRKTGLEARIKALTTEN